jgi:hypothetical protein
MLQRGVIAVDGTAPPAVVADELLALTNTLTAARTAVASGCGGRS